MSQAAASEITGVPGPGEGLQMFAALDRQLEEQQTAENKSEDLLFVLCKIQLKLLQKKPIKFSHIDTHIPRALYILLTLDAYLARCTKIKGIWQKQWYPTSQCTSVKHAYRHWSRGLGWT